MGYLHLVHFTLDEAQALLPATITALEKMQKMKQELDLQGYDLRGHYYFARLGMNGTRNYPEEMQTLIELYRDLNAKGIQVKDIDRGLIDFPCLRKDGQEVYLCYMLGEDRISYWHTIEDGFGGRRSIDEL
jgi:hypothetical protein